MILSNLRTLLAERSLTSSKVSKDTGISRTTIGSLLNDHAYGIRFDTLSTLCNYLRINPGSFFLYEPYDFEVLGIDEVSKEVKIEVTEWERRTEYLIPFRSDIEQKQRTRTITIKQKDGSKRTSKEVLQFKQVTIYIGHDTRESNLLTPDELAFLAVYEKMSVQLKSWLENTISWPLITFYRDTMGAKDSLDIRLVIFGSMK